MPPLPGIDAPHVFRLWTVPDMDRMHTFITERAPLADFVSFHGMQACPDSPAR